MNRGIPREEKGGKGSGEEMIFRKVRRGQEGAKMLGEAKSKSQGKLGKARRGKRKARGGPGIPENGRIAEMLLALSVV